MGMENHIWRMRTIKCVISSTICGTIQRMVWRTIPYHGMENHPLFRTLFCEFQENSAGLNTNLMEKRPSKISI